MKIKIIKSRNTRSLVVADKKINEAYECSQSQPVVLASICNYFESGVYSVNDFRLSEWHIPFSDLGGQPNCRFKPDTLEEREYLLSKLHTYREKDGFILWNTFEISYSDGDNSQSLDKYGVQQSITSQFTYKGAMERLQEIREFWEHWDNPNLEAARIKNPRQQISDADIRMWKRARELEREEKISHSTKSTKVIKKPKKKI